MLPVPLEPLGTNWIELISKPESGFLKVAFTDPEELDPGVIVAITLQT